jgi:molybdopterin converting factor small subunit
MKIEISSDNSVLWSDITTTLLERLPGLAGKVIEVGSGCLASSYAINLNGGHFINQEKTVFKDGDVLIIVPSMAGG